MTEGQSIVKLYNRDILRLAVALADYSLLDDHDVYGEARSQSCGSEITIGLNIDDSGNICGIGMQVKACALGQASAAIFARHALGKSPQDIAQSQQKFANWLTGQGAAELSENEKLQKLDDIWPQLDILSAVSDYPGRHDAVLLVWNGALKALSHITNQQK